MLLCLVTVHGNGLITETSIHDFDRTTVGEEHIERMNIVQFAIRSVNKACYVAAQTRANLCDRACLTAPTDRPRYLARCLDRLF